MTRSALDEKLDEVARISLDVLDHDSDGNMLEDRMVRSFNWLTIADANPDMTAEEIASAAASCTESP